ncbi:DUF1579 domain-containing protein [Nocardia sp. NPDC051832]|uniref:DUF1579 domain-containing protein n=1 Tax=Nocardia sp. NPDC051832 TaxID=3155673 RepID=UPI0034273D5C
MHDHKPQAEHEWLRKLIGQWTFAGLMEMGPGEEPQTDTGTEEFAAFGEYWVRSSGVGQGPDGAPAQWSLSLGFDPWREKFVGNWVSSMGPHMFVYEGVLDAGRTVLTLDSEGPSMVDENTLARYRDSIEFLADDHWVLRSQTLGDDGAWTQFMEGHYRRTT